MLPVRLLLLASSVYAAAVINTALLGPTTTLAAKQAKICSVLDYGGVADGKTDLAPAITKAFACAKAGGATLFIPAGNYSMSTGVILTGGTGFAFQLDGLINLTIDGEFGGNAIVIKNGKDVEFFSSNGKGAIQGNGNLSRGSGQNARLVRFINTVGMAFHDIILVDAPAFHLVLQGVENAEFYHITVHGANVGGTDGVDLTCINNCYLHHIEVTNRDECISVKSPSQNALMEEIYCNHAGGMSIGSVDASSTTAPTVEAITMRNIYTYSSTQMLLIKTYPGGTGAVGYVKNSNFENFFGYDVTYGLDIDQYWKSHTTPDTGAVQISGLKFSNWTGTVDNGATRAPIVIRGSNVVPLTDITLTDINMWTVNGQQLNNECKNAYGSGYCLQPLPTNGTTPVYTSTVIVKTPPAGYVAPVKPSWASEGYGTVNQIPVYSPAALWTSATSPAASSSSSSSSAAAAAAVSAPVAIASASSRSFRCSAKV